MGVDQLYTYLKKETYRRYDRELKQIKIPVQKIVKENKENEATIYANLRQLVKYPDVIKEIYRVMRTRPGRTQVIKQAYYYVK